MCDATTPISNEENSKKRPLQDDYDTTESKKNCVESDRVKRRKFALLLAYSGQGYLGMQRLVLFTIIKLCRAVCGCYRAVMLRVRCRASKQTASIHKYANGYRFQDSNKFQFTRVLGRK
jgi:hypothetical protein